MNLRDAYGMAYPLRDPIDIALNRYLDRYERDEARAEWIEERAEELLKGDYNPYDGQNISEAMGEMSKEQLAGFALGMKLKNYCLAGEELSAIIEAYWLKMAMQAAEDEYDEAMDQ